MPGLCFCKVWNSSGGLLDACVRVLDGACGGMCHDSFFNLWNSSGVPLDACVRALDGACGRMFHDSFFNV